MRGKRVAAAAAALLLLSAVAGFPDGMPDPKPTAAVDPFPADSLWVRNDGIGDPSLAAVPVSPKVIVIYGADLRKSDVNDELAFTLTIGEPGSYEVALEVQPEATQDAVMILELRSEAGDAQVRTRFSISRQECG